MKKKTCYTEIAYVLGILFLACSAALMERADFGISMVIAPAYLLFRWFSPTLPWLTFGTTAYCFEALLLVLMALALRRFRWSWLFSFGTAVLYGFALDLFLMLIPVGDTVTRYIQYVAGTFLGSFGVSMMFHTYLSPEVYELFVKEISSQFHWDIHRVKTIYDCCSCLLGVVLSFLAFGFGQFVGVKLGTVLNALVNGGLIKLFDHLADRFFTFPDALPFRKCIQ